MGLLSRGPGVPTPVRDAVDGKVLAYAETSDGSWLAGSRDALFVIPVEDAPVRVPWQEVQRGDWDTDERTLTVERVEDWGHPTVSWTFVLEEPGAVLVLLRERVTASVVLQRRVLVRGSKGLTVAARRPPAGGPISWSYQFDRGVDPNDPGVMDQAEAALREAQESLGLS